MMRHNCLILEIWTECGRATSENWKTIKGDDVYRHCPSDKPLRFSCGDSMGPKYTSDQFPSMNLLSGKCNKFIGGANTPLSKDYVLAISGFNPSCNEFHYHDKDYDIFMNFDNPGPWACKGTKGTHLKPGWWFSVSYRTGRNA